MYSLFFLYLSEQIYKIMKIKLLLISFLLAANALGAAAQVSKTYYVSKPGTLISMMTEEEANSVTHLTLTGKLNAEDFRHLRDEFANLKVLDISNAEIKMYSGKAGTYPNGKFYIYMPNFIPAYAFSNVVGGVTKGKATLEKVILSEKTKNIEDAAFKGCENLKICQIRKKTAPNLLPEALADSVTAIFVPLGSSDSYRYKDRWQNFAFIEGEPVETTLQVGAMGKLEEETAELRDAIEEGVDPSEELGDMLFAAVNVAAFLQKDPEQVLHDACEKFIRRFGAMESAARQAGRSLDSLSRGELLSLWSQQKTLEQEGAARS